MIFLIIFAFIGGVVTVLSPCILPLLPIILSSSIGGKSKPYGIVSGFIASFTFFTLFLNEIVKFTGVDANSLRSVSILIIALFGISLLIPQTQLLLEKMFSLFSKFTPNSQNKSGFGGGLVIGFSLGLLWTPCVGPILASVITLAVTGSVNSQAFFITLAYSVGTAIPMLIIIKNGNRALQSVPWLVRNTGNIQKFFGIIMILTALGIYFNVDRKFQSYILTTFPNYGTGLTSLEENEFVQESLNQLTNPGSSSSQKINSNNIFSPKAPELIATGQWFNSPTSQGYKISELTEQGKIVLVDFWTYSCINCIRTLPYLRDWHQKYYDDGLVIIGVHTPEFEFEKSASNVQQAINDFEIEYAVMQDNDYLTWRAYQNRYWPAKYLIDSNGKIRYTHFGEGEYDQTEKMIQDLLSEAGKSVNEKIQNEEYSLEPRSPETYLGYARMKATATNEDIVPDKFSNYTKMEDFSMNYPAFEGEWKITPEYAEAKKGSSLVYGFQAKDVYLVMRSDSKAVVKIMLDGQEIDTITVEEDKLYQIIGLEEYGSHVLSIEFLDDGVQTFAFTFG